MKMDPLLSVFHISERNICYQVAVF